LVIGYWSLVIGYWLLVICYWLLVILNLKSGHVRAFCIPFTYISPKKRLINGLFSFIQKYFMFGGVPLPSVGIAIAQLAHLRQSSGAWVALIFAFNAVIGLVV